MSGPSRYKYRAHRRVDLQALPAGHPVRHFSSHWNGLCADRDVPHRRDFSPIEIPYLLPYLVVLDVEHTSEGPELRTRLEGEYLVSLAGKNNVGKSLRKVLGEKEYGLRLEEAEEIMKNRQPVFSEISASDHDGEEHLLLHGMFPFTLNGNAIDQIFIVLGDRHIEL